QLATASTDALRQQYDLLKDKPGITAEALAKMSTKVDEAAIKQEKFRQELEKIDTPMKRFGIAAGAMGDKLTSWGSTLSKNVTVPLMAAGAAVVAFVLKMAGAADELETMSVQTGLSVGKLQELRYVASQTNTKFDSITMAVATMTRNMVESTKEGSKMETAFNRIGVQVKNADGSFRSMNDIFPETLKALADMPPGVERNNLLMQIFGTRAKELIPLLDAGAAGIEAFTAKAHELGLVNPETNKSLADFNDKMDEVKQVLAAAFAELAAKFLPVLRDKLVPFITGKIIPAIRDFADWIGGLIDKFMDLSPETQDFILKALALVVALGPVVTVAGNLTKVAGGLSTALSFLAVKSGLAAAGGWAAAGGATAAGTASAIASPLVTGLGAAFNFMLGPLGLLALGIAGMVKLLGGLNGYVEDSTARISRLEREAYLAAGTLDGDLSPAFGEAMTEAEDLGFAMESTAISAARVARSALQVGDDLVTRVVPPIMTLTDHLEALQSAFSGLGLDLDISKVRFERLVGGLDPLNDKAVILTATLAFEQEQLGLVEQRIGTLSDAYDHLAATKGADNEETKKTLLDLEQEKLKRDDLTRSIAGHSAAIKLQNDAQAKTLTLIGEQQLKLLAAGDITGALALQEVLSPGYKAPKAKEEDISAKATQLAQGLHGVFPDKVVDFTKLYDILKKDPNADFSKIQKAVIGLAGGGTTVNPGIYDVGERGRERVFLPGATTVIPLSGGGLGGNVSQTIIFQLDGQEIARKTVEGMPRVLRALGVTV
ncbi:MAG: hypothetical protein PHU85_20010, partial [Phycisphaerae bacterium]|nr:hypothetical protein [Phycisphaerae bacterium]